MAIFNKDGTVLSVAYNANGESLSSAYDAYGSLIWTSGHIDPTPSSDYEMAVLSAKNAWKAEYEADSTVVPIVLHTDQHGELSSTFARNLFDFLGDAVEWENVSACLNLGDVCNYSVAGFQAMQTCLQPIPASKQINMVGNHDTWTPDWISNTAVPTSAEWDVMYQYYDNSAYNGYVKYGTHLTSESMIDTGKGVKFVVAGAWDYDLAKGGHSHYVISSDNLDAIISSLSVVDNYDIIFLSHATPFSGGRQIQSDGTTYWHIPAVDGGSGDTTTASIGSMTYYSESYMGDLLDARKNKTSGTVRDSYGNTHSYDFTNCTSDLICCLSGHQHADRYNWQGGSDRDLPVVVFDALLYDNKPFYFVNIDRTRERLNIWKVDNTATIYNYQIPFAEQ